MTIAETRKKCKSLAGRIPRDAAIIAVIVLASSASFGLGFLAGRDAGQGSAKIITVGETNEPTVATSPASVSPTEQPTGKVVASKNGTKYYLPDCAAAGRISDTNKVWFVSAAAALNAGYEPAANCKGL
jgi:hypothetical protein